MCEFGHRRHLSYIRMAFGCYCHCYRNNQCSTTTKNSCCNKNYYYTCYCYYSDLLRVSSTSFDPNQFSLCLLLLLLILLLLIYYPTLSQGAPHTVSFNLLSIFLDSSSSQLPGRMSYLETTQQEKDMFQWLTCSGISTYFCC